MKRVIVFLSTLILGVPSISIVSACNDQKNIDSKVEFQLISKIEIKKTYNNKFGIRFYKENVEEKDIIPDNFWYFTDDGKYLAEFNDINNEIKQKIIDVFKIKDTDYYPDFTLLKGWDLKNVILNYKVNNNQKQITNFNANLVADISILLKGTHSSITQEIDQEWIDLSDRAKFTEKWWIFVNTNQYFNQKINNIFINEVKKQINLDINNLDFDSEVWRAPSNVRTDVNNNVISFVISIDVNGKNQLRNNYSYEITIS